MTQKVRKWLESQEVESKYSFCKAYKTDKACIIATLEGFIVASEESNRLFRYGKPYLTFVATDKIVDEFLNQYE